MSGALILWLVLPVLSLAGWFGVVGFAVSRRFGGTGTILTAVGAASGLIFAAAAILNLTGGTGAVVLALGMAALGAGTAVLWPMLGRLSGLAAIAAPILLVGIVR
ncbi:MAG: hypothetical protein ACU0BS_02405 [Hasllibacter sp.]